MKYLVLFSLLFSAQLLYTQSGSPYPVDLDTILVDTSGSAYGLEVLEDSKQRIIVIGHAPPTRMGDFFMPSSGLIWRFLSSGQLDETFGEQGKLNYKVRGGHEFFFGKTLADNSIITAGLGRPNGRESLQILKFSEQGIVDSTFGENGLVQINPPTQIGPNRQLKDIALLPDGKMLVLGNFVTGKEYGIENFIYRLLPNGQFDQNFGENGLVVTKIGPYMDRGVHIRSRSDGKIWVLGITHSGRAYGVDKDFRIDLSLLRFLENGELDLSFGNDGLLKFSGKELFYEYPEVLLINDDELLIAGSAYEEHSAGRPFLLKLNARTGISDLVENNEFKLFDPMDGQNHTLRALLPVADDTFFLLIGTQLFTKDRTKITGYEHYFLEVKTKDNSLNLASANNPGLVLYPNRHQTSPIGMLVMQDGRVVVTGSTKKKVGYPDPFLLRFKYNK